MSSRFGYTGNQCDTAPDFCVNHVCENGATCVSGARNYTCQCPAGAFGIFCGQKAGGIKKFLDNLRVCLDSMPIAITSCQTVVS